MLFFLKAMIGILQVNGFGEESTLMQDLKPFSDFNQLIGQT